MNRRILLVLLCMIFMTFPAWADEEAKSRVIVCGGDAQSTEASAEPKSSTGPADTADTDNMEETGTRGASLGMFTTTGYCGCSNCSGGHNLTYSGTVPKPKHTLSADLDVFPIGTKLMIGDVIYTVEDMGSNVNDKLLDIYYDDHAAAVAHGMKQEEVFAVNP